MTFLLNFNFKNHDKINEMQCNTITHQPNQQQQQQSQTHTHIFKIINKNESNINNEKNYVSNELSNSKQINSLKRSTSKNIIQQKQKKFLEKKNSEELFLIFTMDDL
ncbi:hypothetical protein ACTA71_004442 [Dictyostelium dimigraforme]